VDPPYVVTLPVLPDQHVVLTHDANPMRSSVAGAAAATCGPDGWKRHDAGGHHHFAGGHELSIKLHKTEGVNRSNRQRPGGEAAAYPSQQRVLHDSTPPQIRPVHQEARPTAKLTGH
jgi:hypothetical protein